MTEPTAQEAHNAAIRHAVAEKQNAEFAEALRMAERALGPGFMPWMKLSLVDSDHRQTGDSTAVATVFKVYRGDRKLTENSVYLRRMPDGTVRKADNYEELFGELLHEKHPTKTVEVRGDQVPVGRWELCWSAMETYSPRSAESLAASREKREERKLEKLAESHPLFADEIRSGELQPDKRRRR